jgi:preprotein translocase subunit SecG
LATLLWIVFVVDSILLILIVLLQSGRGGGLSGMLGGGMAEAAVGPKTGLPRITAWMAGIFFVSAILIGYVTRGENLGTLKRPGGKEEQKAPASGPARPGEKKIRTRPLTPMPAEKGGAESTPERTPAPTTPETEKKP